MTNHANALHGERAEAFARRLADEVRVEMARQRKKAGELATVLGSTPHTAGRRLRGATPGFNAIELALIAQWLGVELGEIVARAEKAVAA